MRDLGRATESPGRIYFTGGATAVLLGWRNTTMDIGLKADPEPIGFFEALPRLKNQFDINIELASPDDFVPMLPGWRERSRFIEVESSLEFFHYDFYAQALSKIERWHERDESDVHRMLVERLVQPEKLWELFCAIEPRLIRYRNRSAKAARTSRKRCRERSRVNLPKDISELFAGLPGESLVRKGLADLASDRESIESLLVTIGGPRLRLMKIEVPTSRNPDSDHRLYDRLHESHGAEAHSRYNSLLRELVSFERALENRLSAREHVKK
jgi:hypothetical protein